MYLILLRFHLLLPEIQDNSHFLYEIQEKYLVSFHKVPCQIACEPSFSRGRGRYIGTYNLR